MRRTDAYKLRRALSSPKFAPVSLLALCILVFIDIFPKAGRAILSSSTTDLATEFYCWRQFGFDNLRHGHLAQWNPHVCGGVPFFAGWQAGLLYPPNWIYLVLPLNVACNLDMIISTLLAGIFTSMLARHYRLRPVAQVLSGAIVMFGGPFFPHIYAGHLATLAAMAWIPLVLLAVDSLIDKPNVRTALLATFALSMELLAGHPQTLFDTAIMLCIYTAIRLFAARRRLATIGSLIVVAASAAAITAVQLLPGLQAAGEGVRSHPVGYEFAGEISFQPVNLLTLLIPHLFGDIIHLQYWGPWNEWEMCAFIGIASLPLIVIGALRGKQPRRRLWVTMAILLVVIALGQYTPIFKLLYNHAPGFNRIRAYAKFMYPVSIFLALLAGAGLDTLLCGGPLEMRRRMARQLGGVMTFVAGISALAYLWMLSPITGIWLIRGLRLLSDSYFYVSHDDFPQFAYSARRFAGAGCAIAAVTAVVVSTVLLRANRTRAAAYLVAAIAIVEMFCFARSTMTTFNPARSDAQAVINWIRSHPGDQRVLTTGLLTEEVMKARGFDVWGYNPMVQRRYAEFVTRVENQVPEQANMYISYTTPSPALELLRCSRVMCIHGDPYDKNYARRESDARPNGSVGIDIIPDPLPHGLLIYRYRVMKSAQEIIETVTRPKFVRRSLVMLEHDPGITPQRNPSTPGIVKVKWKDSDTLDVYAQTTAPGIVLITDAYSRFWSATALDGSALRNYRVMPADWALIGVPVGPGTHRFLLHYCPTAFRIGAWISAIGLAAYLTACGLVMRKRC